MTMKFDEFAAWTPEKWAVEHNHQRLGQFVMNELYKVRPDLYQKVTNTDCDSFYNDANLWKLWDQLAAIW